MIKDRNIDPLAAINPSKILGGLGFGVGEVFHVYNSADNATVGHYLRDRIPKSNLFRATTAAAEDGIQAALDATMEERNDYVVIWPSNTTYTLTAALTMSKKCVHLVCPSGMGLERGATNAARIQGAANTSLLILSGSACEVAGLYFKHGTSATASLTLGAAIQYASGSYCSNVHHNYFTINGSGATNSPVVSFGLGSAWSFFHHNKFQVGVDGTTWDSVIKVVAAGANSLEISHNSFNLTAGAGTTITSVINLGTASLYSECNYNIFNVGKANASYGIVASLITQCIYLAESCTAIGNRGACLSGDLLGNYGTITGTSFCDNIDGRTTTSGDGGQVYNLES